MQVLDLETLMRKSMQVLFFYLDVKTGKMEKKVDRLSVSPYIKISHGSKSAAHNCF